mgnify:FL=1
MKNSNIVPVRTAIIYALVDSLPESELTSRAGEVANHIMTLASFPGVETVDKIIESSEAIVNELFSAYIAHSGMTATECAKQIKSALLKNGFRLPEAHMVGKVAAARL